jgi:hypothetical protein
MYNDYTDGGPHDQHSSAEDLILNLDGLANVDISRCRPRKERRKHGAREKARIDSGGLAPMALAMIDDLVNRKVVVHKAGTATGKTYNAASAAVVLSRAGHNVLVALPTLIDCDRFIRLLNTMAPDLFDGGRVAEVFGRRTITETEVELFEGGGDGFPIAANTALIVCTHAQLMRRNWSCYMGGLLGAIEAECEETETEPFHIIIDEYSEFIRQTRVSVPLKHRLLSRGEPDGSKRLGIPLTDCPKSGRFGNCNSCFLQGHGGYPEFNKYSRRVLRRPRKVEVDESGKALHRETGSLSIPLRDFRGPQMTRVGNTTWAMKVEGYGGVTVREAGWRLADIQPLRRSEDDGAAHPPETHEKIVTHLIQCAFRPVIVTEYATGPEGGRIKSADLRSFELDDVRYPRGVCEVPTLLLTDMSALEAIRRYRAAHGVGVLLLGAVSIADDDDVIRAGFPDASWTIHPPSNRKIKQLAVVRMDEMRGLRSLVRDGMLSTIDLERSGQVLVFAGTKELAADLYHYVKAMHGTCCLVDENDKHCVMTNHVEASQDYMTRIAYCRSVLGHGVNIDKLRVIVVDCNAFRPAASFNPKNLTVEEFERFRRQERLALLMQVIGRLPRGEPGKIGVIILLHADDEIMAAIRSCDAINQGCDLPPIYAFGEDMNVVIDQSARYLDGGEWPAPDPGKSRLRKAGRKKTISLEVTLKRAKQARKDGMEWRAFYKKNHLEEYETNEQLMIRKAYDEAA